MADKYIDDTATGLNNGTSPTDAWSNLGTALQGTANFVDGDKVWVRRTTSYDASSVDGVIYLTDDFYSQTPLNVIGWPRASIAISSASWTNGSTTVSLVVGVTLVDGRHSARYITGPDGRQYMITRINSTASFELLTKYTGTTVTGTSGASTIQADPDYSSRPTAGQTAGWDSDSDSLVVITGGGTAGTLLQWYWAWNWVFKNIWLKSAAYSAYGMLYMRGGAGHFENCIFDDIKRGIRLYSNDTLFSCRCCLFRSTGVSSSYESCLYSIFGASVWEDVSIDGMNEYGLDLYGGYHRLTNVNMGVLTANAKGDIKYSQTARVKLRNVNLDGTNGQFIKDQLYTDGAPEVTIMNDGMTVGENRRLTGTHELTRITADGTSPAPSQRTGGSPDVLQAVATDGLTTSRAIYTDAEIELFHTVILEQGFNLPSGTSTIRFYIQPEVAIASGVLTLRAHYPDPFTSSTTYFPKVATATKALSARSSQSDWSQYLEISVTLDAAATVLIDIKSKYYDTTGDAFYIDPLPVVT